MSEQRTLSSDLKETPKDANALITPIARIEVVPHQNENTIFVNICDTLGVYKLNH